MNTPSKTLVILALAAAVPGCHSGDKESSKHDEVATQSGAPSPMEEKPADGIAASGGVGAAMALDEGKMGRKDSDRAEGQYRMQKEKTLASRDADDAKKPEDKGGKSANGTEKDQAEATTRAWFPETFLWNPLVVTNAQGVATVPVRVPDRLTTWRILALAHSRSGAQGGAATSFLGTLPTYVDLVVPPFLIVGDEIRLPIQVVNTTEAAITTNLAIAVDNATLGGGGGSRTIAAGGSLVEYVTLKATKAGELTIKATLGSTDAVIRTIDVLPAGKPVVTNRSGTLAAPRTLTIEGPAASDPTTDRARLVVYPGALALLRSELTVSTARLGIGETAYALLLAGRAPALLAALGDKPDLDAIRDLSLLTAQRVIRTARNLDVDAATLIVEAALAHPQNPVMVRLGERASTFLAKNQRPDGSFGGGNGWTLQRVLVATADGTRAVLTDTATVPAKQRAQQVAAKASGMVERNFERITDGYTAAAILASGSIKGALADKLRAKVLESIKSSDDGAKYLDVPSGVVRSDGTVPTRAEATALAVLALTGDPQNIGPDQVRSVNAPLADLGATLLGSYSPVRGWGDGRTNLVAMRAVLQLFKDPVASDVKITLLVDGKELTSGQLDRKALREVLALEVPAPGIAGKHEWKVIAEPAVPGLGYALVLNSWVPWSKETTNQGLELALPARIDGAVGKPTEIAVSAIAPAGELHITQALAAGVQVDTPSLQALVTAGTIERFELSDGKLELFVPALQPGQTFAAKYKVIPTLAGTLHSAASQIEQGANAFHVQPTTWVIK